MAMQFRILFFALMGTALTISSGIVYGRLGNRWGANGELARVGDHVMKLPEIIGNWTLVATDKLADSDVEMLQCSGYTIREYVNSTTGASVKLALLAGPPGPISVHTPEVCYSSRAWTLEHDRARREISAGLSASHEFWAVTMKSTKATGERMRVYYGWSTGNTWHASQSPRYEFAGKPYLVKLQLARELPFGLLDESTDPCREFLSQFVACGWEISGRSQKRAPELHSN
jgi:hypothetical protein